ncbi:MAG TPA: hypothetical protein VNG29_03440 [Candidatus Paceibacterota bacterium]|nr:hypothetical protein [Candidatus Paceibacterota bacterium]
MTTVSRRGIEVLDPKQSFEELFGFESEIKAPAEKQEKEEVHIARCLCVADQFPNQVLAVFNGAEIRNGKVCDRPHAFGMSGGKVSRFETPEQAIRGHEYGEIPYRIIDLAYLFSTEMEDRGSRFEQTHFFVAKLDGDSPCGFTTGEAVEIKTAEFFTMEEILAMGEKPTLETKPEDMQMYKSHKKFFIQAREKYQELKTKGEIDF